MKYVASVSWGKDSLAMLILILKNYWPIDEVVFFDTGWEFQSIYDTAEKFKPILADRGIKYTVLKPSKSFDFMSNDHIIKCRNGNIKKGYGWCGGSCRWGTTIKTRVIYNYLSSFECMVYVGIAYDERERVLKYSQTKNRIFPLVQMQVTEKQALAICYSCGYKWIENGFPLYDALDRVSCWRCRNKNLKELGNMKKFLPKYFEELKKIESIHGCMKPPRTLSERFPD